MEVKKRAQAAKPSGIENEEKNIYTAKKNQIIQVLQVEFSNWNKWRSDVHPNDDNHFTKSSTGIIYESYKNCTDPTFDIQYQVRKKYQKMNDYDSNPTTVDEKQKSNFFYMHEANKVSFFPLTVLTGAAPHSNIALTLPINQRNTVYEEFMKPTAKGFKPISEVIKANAVQNPEYATFQTNTLCGIFYSVCRKKTKGKNLPEPYVGMYLLKLIFLK